jgi:hypothetical protein
MCIFSLVSDFACNFNLYRYITEARAASEERAEAFVRASVAEERGELAEAEAGPYKLNDFDP